MYYSDALLNVGEVFVRLSREIRRTYTSFYPLSREVRGVNNRTSLHYSNIFHQK